MEQILLLFKLHLPMTFTRKQYMTLMRTRSSTSHPLHYLQVLTEKGKLHHIGSSRYRIA